MLRGVGRRCLKAHWTEAIPIQAHFLFRDPFPNQLCGDGREQDSAAKMSRGHQQTVEIGGAQDW